MKPDTPIFRKTYDWSLWLFQRTAGFPKRFRQSLTSHMENGTLLFEERIVLANHLRSRARASALIEADGTLTRLRFNLRRCFDLRIISEKQYRFASGQLAEIGRLLGAWLQMTTRAREEA